MDRHAPTSHDLHDELERLLDAGVADAPTDRFAQDPAAREDAVDSIDAQILAGLVSP
jgi:hypothetical protein